MTTPLSGLRVLDLSRVMAGPWCTQILADLGAEVIKVERPISGDETRHWGPPWLPDGRGNETEEGSYFLAANRGKHSLTLDINSPDGQQIIKELAAQSDILVENFKLGSLAKKGLDYKNISAINPAIIYCSITGFGQTGPRAKEPGYDYLIQAMSGMMSVTGREDDQAGGGPIRVGVPIADLATGFYSCIGILSALHHRQKTGQGQYIDMALLDSQMSCLSSQASNYFLSGKRPTRTGEWHPNLAPYQPFQTSDGSLIIAIGNDEQFKRFCAVTSLDELAEDSRFQKNSDRNIHRKELVHVIQQVLEKHTTESWIEKFKHAGIPSGPLNHIDEIMQDPQVQQRNLEVKLDHSSGTTVTSLANPIKFSETPVEYNKPPPTLGEDTDYVLSQILDKTKEEIEHLRNKNII